MPQGNNTKLSIIIPVYNEDQYILKLLDELKYFFNSHENEIIIVDDGSTDNSLNLVNQYKNEKDYNFLLKVIKIENNAGKGNAIQRVFIQCNRNVSETARRLRMHRRTLQRILNKHAPRE